MQPITTHISPIIPPSRGGRISSPALRHSQQLCEDFTGLTADTNRYDLLLLVKRAGKAAGFSSKMIHLLDYYFAFTRECDWEQGARPIVYQSLAKTSLDLGVSERHIQRLEQALFEAGAVTWCDSGNHRRYGQRCPKTGAILYAFGVDLSPLAALKPKLEAILEEKTLRDRAWMEAKRQISFYRRQINALLAEAEEGVQLSSNLDEVKAAYERLCVPIRTYLSLETLRGLLAEHKSLYAQILAQIEPDTTAGGGAMSRKESPRDDQNVVHKEPTTQESFNELNCGRAASGLQGKHSPPPGQTPSPEPVQKPEREEGRQTPPNLSTGLQHITLKQVLNAASEPFRAHIPMEPRAMNWADLVEAAYRRKSELRIRQESWAEACVTLGRNGAALCLLLTDQATLRPVDPVLKPGAYFQALVNRARTGELDLQRSIFGLLKREEGNGKEGIGDGR